MSNVVWEKIRGRLGIRLEGIILDLQVHILAYKYKYQTTQQLYSLLGFLI